MGASASAAAGNSLGVRVLEPDLDSFGDALDLFDDGVRQGIGLLPQRRELFVYPRNAFGRGVFPQDLVVLREGALRLVDRAEEAGGRTVGLVR